MSYTAEQIPGLDRWKILRADGKTLCHIGSTAEKDNLLAALNAKTGAPDPYAYTILYHQSEEMARNNGEPTQGLTYGPGGREPFVAYGKDQAVKVLGTLQKYNAPASGVEYRLYALVREPLVSESN